MSEETSATRRRTQARRQSIVGTEPVAYVRNKYERLSWALDERQRRLWAANEAVALGYGGCSVVAEATGLSDRTVQLGLRELQQRGRRCRRRRRAVAFGVPAGAGLRPSDSSRDWKRLWKSWSIRPRAAIRSRRCVGPRRVCGTWKPSCNGKVTGSAPR